MKTHSRILCAAGVAAFLLLVATPARAACTTPAASGGDIIYNSDDDIMQYCDGTDWIAFPKSGATPPVGTDPCRPSASPAIGTACLDGTKYAGTSPDGGVPMYAARCDYGMSWNGAACVGTRGTLTWNNGTTGWTGSNTTAESTTDGDGNTEILEDWAMSGDPDERLLAGRYCGKLSLDGHSDWYLPAIDELQVLYTNRTAIANFRTDNVSTNRYWSSTDDNSNSFNSWMFRFHSSSGGASLIALKNVDYHVRCVRQGYVQPCENPFGMPGDILYNNDDNVLQWCGGGQWHAAGPYETYAPDTTNLSARWPLDESSGSPMDPVGGYTKSTSGSPTWQPSSGKFGGALQFDGIDDYTETIGVFGHLGISDRPYSFALWVKRDAGETTGDILGMYITLMGWRLSPISMDNSRITVTSWTGSTAVQVTGTTTLAENVWYHIANTWDSTNGLCLYINGGLEGCAPQANFDAGGGNKKVTLGYGDLGGSGSESDYFKGLIDEVLVYDKSLSAAEVAVLGQACNTPAGNYGDIIFNDDYNALQYCNGTNWVSISKEFDPCVDDPTPSPGARCADGTIYAGLTPDGSVKMFVTRCDMGMTWGGSSCTGSRTTLPWNNNTGTVTNSGVTNGDTGEANTATLIITDSDGTTGGVQPHQAAQYCADLSANGYDDWFLPAFNEMEVIRTSYAIIGNFTTINAYWSSTGEGGGPDYAAGITMPSGYSTLYKSIGYHVRCARK